MLGDARRRARRPAAAAAPADAGRRRRRCARTATACRRARPWRWPARTASCTAATSAAPARRRRLGGPRVELRPRPAAAGRRRRPPGRRRRPASSRSARRASAPTSTAVTRTVAGRACRRARVQASTNASSPSGSRSPCTSPASTSQPSTPVRHRERRRRPASTVPSRNSASPRPPASSGNSSGPLLLGGPLDARPDRRRAASGTWCGCRARRARRRGRRRTRPASPSPTRCSLAVSYDRHAASATCGGRGARPVRPARRAGTPSTAAAAASSAHEVAVSSASTSSGSGVQPRGRANGSRVPPPEWQQSRIDDDVRRRWPRPRRSAAQLLVGEAAPELAVDAPAAVVEHRASGSARSARGRRSPAAPAPRCRGRRRRTARRRPRPAWPRWSRNAVDDGVPGRLGVEQRPQRRASSPAAAPARYALEGGDVVAAPVQRVDRRLVGVDADEQGVASSRSIDGLDVGRGVVDDADQPVHRVGEPGAVADALDAQAVVARRAAAGARRGGRRRRRGAAAIGAPTGRPVARSVTGDLQRQVGARRAAPARRAARRSPSSSSASSRTPWTARNPVERPGGEDAEQLGLHRLGVLQRGVAVGRSTSAGTPAASRRSRSASPTRAAPCRRRPCPRRRRRSSITSRSPSQRADCLVPWVMPTTEWIAYVAGSCAADAGLDGPVEVVQRAGGPGPVDAGQPIADLGDALVAVAEVDARVDRQQLVHRRQRAQQRR